jgi:hypothetical protein
MMSFFAPWVLLGLLPVAAVAAWAIFRPGRELAVVASLSLWRQALEALPRAARRRSRRVTPSWVLLLAGAVAAVLAASRPAYHADAPARRVALAVYPSAELAGAGGAEELRAAAGALLDRLDARDRVRLVLPAVLGGRSDWLAPADVRLRLDRLEPLPVPAGEMSLPLPADAQHVYRFAPASLAMPDGAALHTVQLPPRLPPVTLDALAAAPLPDGRVRLLAAIRSRRAGEWRGRLNVVTYGAAGGAPSVLDVPVSVAGGRRVSWSGEVQGGAAVAVSLRSGGADLPAVGGQGFLVRRAAAARRVLLAGPDEPLLRRFVGAVEGLTLVGGAEEADFVIANGADPPPDKAALAINPPTSPPLWRRAEAQANVLLGGLSVAPDPITDSVDFSGVAVRRVRPWVKAAPAAGALARGPQGAYLLRPPGEPKRVYLAFDVAEANTNFARLPAFVILLANVVEYLAPGGESGFVCRSPTEAELGWSPDWPRIAPAAPPPGGPLPWPGIYREPARDGRDAVLHAVSLTGLRGGEPDGRVREAVAELPLPAPERVSAGVALWPVLAAAAVVLWLAGWAARAR